jgi:ribosome-binding protein aMBF1 (putative translation factor)
MLPEFNRDGRLPAGIHWATWQEIQSRFGFSSRRQQLLGGLRLALAALNRAGCSRVYIDGSFVTVKREPGDYDACWDIDGVNVEALDSVFLDFSKGRTAQKRKYFGEFFPEILELDSLEGLPKVLIQARIAAGLTQEDLAARLGVKPQQIQRYEASDYQTASFARLREIARLLGLDVRERVEMVQK